MHIINSPKGTYYIADTMVNENPDRETLLDISKLISTAVRFFNEKPVIAMVSHSNFGSSTSDGALKVKDTVAKMHELYPDLPIDGEMLLSFALDNELRDQEFPFTKLKGQKVNTLVFPNLTSARSSYKMLQMLGSDAEIIGPIQMGLNKPIHFIDFGASVRDVVNIVAVATIDAYVDKIKNKLSAIGK
jgi:malate dehydrogenase (oxaloacetate-decarboxylating)(NADP+)